MLPYRCRVLLEAGTSTTKFNENPADGALTSIHQLDQEKRSFSGPGVAFLKEIQIQ